MSWAGQTHVGDCRVLMRRMIADGVQVQCVVTSPPYWGIRDFGIGGKFGFGLERTPKRFVARLRGVFRLVRKLLAPDGVLWLNLGDTYRDKNLVGIPWLVAFALQWDGWYLRSDVIWHKPSPVPESITDRPTKAHEYIFLMAKSANYYYDYKAISEPALTAGRLKKPSDGVGYRTIAGGGTPSKTVTDWITPDLKNSRSVWTIHNGDNFPGEHFGYFPRNLVARCILAGSRPGDIVFDPFMGTGTVAEVALSLGRQFIGCEINPEYAAMQTSLRSTQQGLSL